MHRSPLSIPCLIGLVLLAPAPASALPTASADRAPSLVHPAQWGGQCSRRLGPFATQTTAWTRWRQARSQGYAVSNGIYRCGQGDYYGGYCFNVFYRC